MMWAPLLRVNLCCNFVFGTKRKGKNGTLLMHMGLLKMTKKDKFLAEVAHFCSRNKDPYLICGDFNLIRYPSQKNKKTTLKRSSRMFNTIIDAYELIDIDMIDGKFTWSNNQNPPTLERLDRFLMSKGWEDIFPRVTLRKKPERLLTTILSLLTLVMAYNSNI
jgi:hypothetical protein